MGADQIARGESITPSIKIVWKWSELGRSMSDLRRWEVTGLECHGRGKERPRVDTAQEIRLQRPCQGIDSYSKSNVEQVKGLE